MAKRLRVIVPGAVPSWEDVVRASEYDALFARYQDLQARVDRLKCSPRRDRHDQHCEQEGGDPFCSCFAREHKRRSAAQRGEGRE